MLATLVHDAESDLLEGWTTVPLLARASAIVFDWIWRTGWEQKPGPKMRVIAVLGFFNHPTIEVAFCTALTGVFSDALRRIVQSGLQLRGILAIRTGKICVSVP